MFYHFSHPKLVFFEPSSHKRNRANPTDILEKNSDTAQQVADAREELFNNVGLVLDDFYLNFTRLGSVIAIAPLS